MAWKIIRVIGFWFAFMSVFVSYNTLEGKYFSISQAVQNVFLLPLILGLDTFTGGSSYYFDFGVLELFFNFWVFLILIPLIYEGAARSESLQPKLKDVGNYLRVLSIVILVLKLIYFINILDAFDNTAIDPEYPTAVIISTFFDIGGLIIILLFLFTEKVDPIGGQLKQTQLGRLFKQVLPGAQPRNSGYLLLMDKLGLNKPTEQNDRVQIGTRWYYQKNGSVNPITTTSFNSGSASISSNGILMVIGLLIFIYIAVIIYMASGFKLF